MKRVPQNLALLALAVYFSFAVWFLWRSDGYSGLKEVYPALLVGLVPAFLAAWTARFLARKMSRAIQNISLRSIFAAFIGAILWYISLLVSLRGLIEIAAQMGRYNQVWNQIVFITSHDFHFIVVACVLFIGLFCESRSGEKGPE